MSQRPRILLTDALPVQTLSDPNCKELQTYGNGSMIFGEYVVNGYNNGKNAM